MTVLISGTCNDCGQCCGCETAPNRTSPFPGNWPEAVRNWEMEFLANTHLIFKIVSHPVIGGAIYGSFKIATGTYYWRWVPGHGLCANSPPWADPNTWEPQCPVLMGANQGTYPCGIKDVTINMPGGPVEGNAIRQSMSCRELGMPPTMRDDEWEQWHRDHPACSYVATPV